MHIHPAEHDQAGAGRWDKSTTRYVPMGGGSRSRLPIANPDDKYPRYHGIVGIDEKLTDTIFTIGALYQHMGGAPEILAGNAGTLASRIQNIVEEQRKADAEAVAAAAKAEKMASLKGAE
jgi:hypothetical protein